MIYFTSDIHHRHKRICEITDRHKVVDQAQHDEWLIELWNRQVTKQDTVYHLGDFSFASKYEDVAAFTTRLNGAIFLLKGNHDKTDNLNKLKSNNLIQHWYDYKEIQIRGITTCMFHFPISSWHKQHYGSFCLHGHCVDYETEVLTSTGFKSRHKLSKEDKVCTYNSSTKEYEYSKINSIIDTTHSGKVYSYDGKSVNFRVTDRHTIVGLNITSGEYFETEASRLPSVFKVITSAIANNKGTGLSRSLLALYILIAADGSIKTTTNLVRIRIKKKHKIEYLTKILCDLKLKYNTYNSCGYSSFNFYIPDELKGFEIKGLDIHVLNANQYEAETIVEAYRNSDGAKQKNGVIIYTAKKIEYDILQALFVQNGYMVTGYSRFHGFGQNIQYQLSVTKNSTQIVQSHKVVEEYVEDEKFWCLTTNNQNFVMRRNGRVHLTGNSHGNHSGSGKLLDVGLDSAYNILGEHRLFTQDEIYEILSNKQVTINDSHRKEKTP